MIEGINALKRALFREKTQLTNKRNEGADANTLVGLKISIAEIEGALEVVVAAQEKEEEEQNSTEIKANSASEIEALAKKIESRIESYFEVNSDRMIRFIPILKGFTVEETENGMLVMYLTTSHKSEEMDFEEMTSILKKLKLV